MIASFDPSSWWSVGGTFTVASEELCVRRSGFRNETFLLQRGDSVLAEANRLGMFRFGLPIQVQFGEIRCEVRPTETEEDLNLADVIDYAVWQGENEIGQVSTKHRFRKQIYIDLPHNWPIELRLFIFWLVQCMWLRG
jgi:hypothetical protein